MTKKLYILGGGTNTYISNHLALSAPAYGTTAKTLANKFRRHEENKMEAYLFVTKKGSVWIPKAMIYNIKKTKKGKYIIDVYSSFKLTYMNAYFNCFKYTRKNYERT